MPRTYTWTDRQHKSILLLAQYIGGTGVDMKETIIDKDCLQC